MTAQNPEQTCATCGAVRHSLDMARIDGVPYCHGDHDADPTCYMRAAWGDAPMFVRSPWVADGPERAS